MHTGEILHHTLDGYRWVGWAGVEQKGTIAAGVGLGGAISLAGWGGEITFPCNCT